MSPTIEGDRGPEEIRRNILHRKIPFRLDGLRLGWVMNRRSDRSTRRVSYAETILLIDARIAELEAAGRDPEQGDATAQTPAPVVDARIALLGELRTAVQRESVLAARLRELDGALAESQAVGLAGSARTLYERRYALLQGEESALWPTWLRETQLLIKDMSDESAGEMLLVKDQVQSPAQRLRDQLEPLVSERSLDQHLDAAKLQLESWWNTELFVIQDHGIYARDLVTGAVVFTLVLILVSFLRTLLRRTVLPKLVEGPETERKTARAAVLALIRNTSQVFVLIVAFYAAMTVSGLAQGHLEVWLWTLLVVAVYVQVGIRATAGLVDFVQRQRSKKEQLDPSAVTGYGLLLFFLRVGVWILVVVSVMAHFEYPIAGLIGALGVGGIVVAFAVQNILSEVFHSMAINLAIYRKFQEEGIQFAYPTQELIVRRPSGELGGASA